ncbi:hypothetical protein ABIE86_005168 [Bradyrhizobium diazoefficiens]
MTIDRPMFPPRAESVDSFSSRVAVGQRKTGKRTSDSPGPVPSPSNVLTFPGRKFAPACYQPTGRQAASRKRNPLRHPCHSVSHAVTIAGKIHRGEALRTDPFLDEAAILWKGVEAARLLVTELFDLAVKQSGSVDQ